MRASKVAFLTVAAAILLGAGGAFAQICANVTGSCNSYFFGLAPTTAPDVVAISGFEYGCGNNNRYASGVIRIKSDGWYISFSGVNHEFDGSQAVAWNAQVSPTTLAGSYDVLYTYLSSGSLTAHSTSGSVQLAGCSEPAIAASEGEDTSLSK